MYTVESSKQVTEYSYIFQKIVKRYRKQYTMYKTIKKRTGCITNIQKAVINAKKTANVQKQGS
jgi:hypothetical protein